MATGDRPEWIPIITGRAWALGLDVPADLIGTDPASVLAAVDTGLAAQLEPGDVLVAGSFGAGTSDEGPVRALLELGLGAVLAGHFDDRFRESATAAGLRVALLTEALGIQTGDRLRVDLEGGRIVNQSTGDRYPIRDLDAARLARFRETIRETDARS